MKIPAGYKKLPVNTPGNIRKGDIVKYPCDGESVIEFAEDSIGMEISFWYHYDTKTSAVYRRVSPKRKPVDKRIITFARLWDIVLQAQTKGTALSKRTIEEQFKMLRRAGK